MKKIKLTLLAITMLMFAGMTNAQTLVHYWNFNDNTNQTTLLTPNVSIVSTPTISHIAGGASELVATGGTGQDFDINNLNARNGDTAGSHLRFNDPIGGALEFHLPTSGYNDIVVRFATRRSGSGAGTQYWSYSTNGTDFTLFDSIFPSSVGPELKTLDLRSNSAVNNNANFKLKVEFAQGPGGSGGNNRFDNFSVESIPPTGAVEGVTLDINDISVEVGANQTLVATISPANATNKSLTWSSSDAAIATVDTAGKVTGVAAGTTKVFVTTVDGGFMDSCNVTVTQPSGLDLIYYWHFNNFNPPAHVTEIPSVDFALINNSGARIDYTLTPDPAVDNQDNMDRFSPGTLLNVQQGVSVGGAARVRNPSINRTLVFTVPTTGTKDIQMALAIQRSNNGALTNTIEYSIDGTNFISTGLDTNVRNVEGAEIWQIHSYDFTGITGVDNNPNFKIRIRYTDANASNPSGNNRYDNVTIMGVNVNANTNIVENQNEVSVYPNPSNGIVTIETANNKSIQNVMVIDMSGRVVVETSETTLDLNHLNNGMYFIMSIVDGVTYRNRIILTK